VKDRQHARSWYWRFVIAAGVLCGAVLALLAAIVIIAPKAINSGEVRSRIEAVIAKELNGTFTYDRVELSLLPRPDVVLYRVVIDIPGTLSATISAVRVRARLLPLFRGRFAVSSIALEKPALTLLFPDETARRRSRKPPGKQPAGGSLDKALTVASRELPDLSINLSRGKISLLREGRSFLSLVNLETALAFVSDRRDAPNAGATGTDYHITGAARATLSEAAYLPAPLTLSVDRFDAIPVSLTIKSSRARLQDLDASISGDIQGYLTSSPRSDIAARGTIGPDALAWMQTLAGLPDGMRLRAPLTVTAARLRSTGTGSAVSRTLTVNAKMDGDTILSLALRQMPGLFSIDSLHVKDSDSDGEIKFSRGAGGVDLSFAGNLTGATIDRMLERGRLSSAWLTGDLRVQAPHGTWKEATIHGSLEGGQFSIPASREIPVTLDRFTLLADGTKVGLKSAVLSVGQDVLHMNGTVSLSGNGVELDLDVATDRVSLSTLRALVERKTPEQQDGKRTEPGSRPDVSGSVRLRAKSFIFDRYQSEGLDVNVTFGRERTEAILEHASLCGITFIGSLRTVGSEIEVALTPNTHGKKLEESLPCIFRKDMGISGSYDLSAKLASRGTWDTLLRSLEGDFVFSSSKGRIQSGHVVKGVIAYLNSTSLLKGSHDKLLKEGVPYETVTLRGTLHDGSLSLSEGVIKSRDLNIAADGKIDLREGTLSLDVLAAPFTRLDRLLGNVPLVKYLVGNALVVVPARVEGTFEHPSVKPLPVSGVGMNVTNLMKNALAAPMKIIDPVVPKELERKNAPLQE
jgi:hypothetical protein